jgi:hypothetical protein
MIPQLSELDIGKMHKGSMTDTWDKACKQCCVLTAAITEAAKNCRVPNSMIKIFELDCWHQMRTIWFDNVIKQKAKAMHEVVDLQPDMPSNMRIHVDIVQLLCAIEKECAQTSNYKKGHGDELWYILATYHQNEYLFPHAGVCGDTQQDIG